MDMVLALIDRLREEMVIKKLLHPGEGETTEFHFGRLVGMLFMLEFLKEQLDVEREAQAARREEAERNFDAA